MSDAIVETTRPVSSNQPEAAATSPHPKNLVKVRSGATFVSTTNLREARRPVARPQPINAEKIPSRRNGS
jgi:hypothetical protein